MRHLEEGEIHAWLDGAVAADEAARMETHVAGCAQCAEEVATARGLIAGASRILLALDSVPGGVIPGRVVESSPALPAAASSASSTAHGSADRKQTGRRHVPWFSRPLTRIAAGLVLAAGIGTLAVRRVGDEAGQVTIEFRAESAVDLSGRNPATAPSGPAPILLDSAIPPASTSATSVPAPEGQALADRAPLPAAAADAQFSAGRAAGGAVQGGATGVGERRGVASNELQGKSGAAALIVQPPRMSAPPSSAAAAPTAPVREEARAQVGRGGAGGGAGSGGQRQVAEKAATTAVVGGVARDSGAVAVMQRPDSARLSRQELRLSTVVTTGVASPTAGVRVPYTVQPVDSLSTPLGLAAVRASLPGACFDLSLAAQAEVPRGETPLPAGMRIRLADLQNLGAYAARADVDSGARDLAQMRTQLRSAAKSPPPPQAQAAAAAAPEPLETVAWESVAGDSIIARRLVGIDVLALRLAIAGDQVTGTAAWQTATTRPARVTGRRISCDGF